MIESILVFVRTSGVLPLRKYVLDVPEFVALEMDIFGLFGVKK